MHILPDLVRLEAKYPGVLVVISVHSPKFPHEKATSAIHKAVLRYHIDHPVINDANLALWRGYGVGFWPTFVLIDPEGNFYGKVNGEGLYQVLDFHIGKLVKEYEGKNILKKEPIKYVLERTKAQTPLFFPGKILADEPGKRLFISDSSNNRVVITDMEGKKIAIAGTGKEGRQDGSFAQATFADPQGLALNGDILYVADRKNHCIRALDLKSETVKTVAGTGEQDRTSTKRAGPALQVGLNSPWGLLVHKDILYIAMAGHHQIWVSNLKSGNISPLAGTGEEELKDGLRQYCAFAQPSGLGTDGTNLYIADCEVSAIRTMDLKGRGPVSTIVGAGLFEFGDVNGVGSQVRLQHALDVQYHQGKLYVADTYNHKIKLIDPARRTCVTFSGDTPATFDEPSGLAIAGNKLYVADTGAHRIRIVYLDSRQVTTLDLQGVDPIPRPTGKAEQQSEE